LLEGAIHIIPDEWKMPRGGLDADLMRFSGDEIDLQQRKTVWGTVMPKSITQFRVRSWSSAHGGTHLMLLMRCH
jgi:hypothetical protein